MRTYVLDSDSWHPALVQHESFLSPMNPELLDKLSLALYIFDTFGTLLPGRPAGSKCYAQHITSRLSSLTPAIYPDHHTPPIPLQYPRAIAVINLIHLLVISRFRS
ncbi:hypothetical protein FRC12_002128 [Ceratobasidium sp. 428]|nr:hypothetical protein FRC12_002128 [Ceratobasidium sp. 428]